MLQLQLATERKRLHTLDVLRGFMLILVMVYHFCYDLVVFFSISMPWLFAWQGEAARIFMTGSLMIIAGISSSLSRNNAKRGSKTLGYAMALTIITYIALPEKSIWFGILHYFGVMMLIYHLFQQKINKLPLWTIHILIVLFILLFQLPSGYILTFALPTVLYQSQWTFWLGLPHDAFSSADYYPLLPWSMLFLIGAVLGCTYKKSGFPVIFYRIKCAPIEFIGRYTLLFYLIHQPIILAILTVIFDMT